MSTFLKVHEKLLIFILIAASFVWLGTKYLNNLADRDSKQYAALTQQLKAQQDINAQNAAVTAQVLSQYTSLVSSLTQKNNALQAAQTSRNTVLKAQQQADSALKPTDLAVRWTTLSNLNPSGLTVTPLGLTVSEENAQTTVQQLEQIPVLTQNLKAESDIADNNKFEADKAGEVISAQTQQITGLNTQIQDQDKACKAEVTSIKASARTSKIKWFFRGVGVGALLVTGLVLHF